MCTSFCAKTYKQTTDDESFVEERRLVWKCGNMISILIKNTNPISWLILIKLVQ